MRVVAFLDVLVGELDFADFVVSAFARHRADLEPVSLHRDDIEVVQVNGVARVGDDRAHIAREEILLLAHAEDERTAAPRADDEIRDVAMDERDAVSADHLLQRRPHGRHQATLRIDRRRAAIAAGGIKKLANQMRQHFGVRLGNELVLAVAEKVLLQRLVIFDHPVVHQRELAALVEMRMRVLIRRLPVRGPASVADSVGAGRRPRRHQLPQFGNAAGAFARLDLIPIYDRHAGRIVAAIFQPTQPIQKNRPRLRTSYVTNDAAHRCEV